MAREVRLDAILRDLQSGIAAIPADVWLLQEAAERSSPTITALASALNLHYVFAPADRLDGGKLNSGLAVLSRYPIVDSRVIELARHDLKFNTRCRIALVVWIEGPFGRVPFYNVHLDTRITERQRLEQMMPVLEAAGTEGPVVIGGDFNTSNVKWIWNLLPFSVRGRDSLRVQDAFRSRGFASPFEGAGGTLDVLWLSLHLDWIFPRALRSIASGTIRVPFSDHDAVWVDLEPGGTGHLPPVREASR